MGRRVTNELMSSSCHDEDWLFPEILEGWSALANGLRVILGLCSEVLDSHGSSLIICPGASDSLTVPGKE